MIKDVLRDFARSLFQPKPAVTAANDPLASEGKGNVIIQMPGERKRGVSVPVIVGGVVVVGLGLAWSGHKSAKVEPSPLAIAPTPTDSSTISGLHKPEPKPISQDELLAKAIAAYADQHPEMKQPTPAELAAAQQQANQMYGTTGQTQNSRVNANQLTPAQQAAEERRKREEESLAASSVIPIPEATSNASQNLSPFTQQMPNAVERESSPVATPSEDKTREDCPDHIDGSVVKYPVCEGTYIPLFVNNRLNGEFAGPVKAYVLQDILAQDGQRILIPRGSLVLGEASHVGSSNQKRMDVSFHRIILPGGRGFSIGKMIALDQAGETALAGKLNRHLVQTFTTAAIIGAISGFSQFGAGSAYTGNGIDTYRNGVASATAQQGQTILQRDLNRPNEITIPEGKVAFLYVGHDLPLPEFIPPVKAQPTKGTK